MVIVNLNVMILILQHILLFFPMKGSSSEFSHYTDQVILAKFTDDQ